MRTPKVIIRDFQETDREKVRAIFCDTGQRGNPLSTYIEDEEVVLRLLADYYMDYEPQWCFVAEVDGQVVGYVLGCPDTRRYYRLAATRIVPLLLARILWKLLTLQYRQRKTYHTLWWCLTRARRQLPRAPVERYPAHCHVAIANSARHLQVGPRLVDRLAERLQEHRVPGLHGIVLEEVGKNAMARALRGKVLAARRTTIWDKWTGKQWEAKLLVREL